MAGIQSDDLAMRNPTSELGDQRGAHQTVGAVHERDRNSERVERRPRGTEVAVEDGHALEGAEVVLPGDRAIGALDGIELDAASDVRGSRPEAESERAVDDGLS